MGVSGGLMDVTIEVGEMARLPDGTSAEVTRVEEGTVYGTRRLTGGKTVRFHCGEMQWAFLRQGIIPEQGNAPKPPRKVIERNFCDDDLRDRQWNPHSGKCENCGRWIPEGHYGYKEL